MNIFYVYLHRKATTMEIFYVGKGHGNRAYTPHGRNEWWNKIANKHGFTVEIHTDNLSEHQAFQLEEQLIAKYGRRDLGEGTLVNFTSGGEGTKGLRCPDDKKLLLSEYFSGLKNPNADLLVYEFIHKNGQCFNGTRFEFKQKFGIELVNLFHGTSNYVKGWTIRGWEDLPCRVDETVYSFLHQRSGEIFKGTRLEFKQKYNLNIKPLFSTKRRHKLCKGWCLSNEHGQVFHIYRIHNKVSDSYFVGTKEEFKGRYPDTDSHVFASCRKTYTGGWFMIERIPFCPYIP